VVCGATLDEKLRPVLFTAAAAPDTLDDDLTHAPPVTTSHTVSRHDLTQSGRHGGARAPADRGGTSPSVRRRRLPRRCADHPPPPGYQASRDVAVSLLGASGSGRLLIAHGGESTAWLSTAVASGSRLRMIKR